VVLDGRIGRGPRETVEFPLEPREHAGIRPPRIGEDHEPRVSRRGLLVKIVDESEDPLDAGMHDEGVEAIHDEDAGSSLVEERRRGGPEVLEASGVHGAGPFVKGRHPEEVSALDPGRRGPGSDPEERRVRLRQEADDGDRVRFPIEGEIALAALQRRSDDTPP
jgi:hypothetical protein